jgi:hypothetical protein
VYDTFNHVDGSARHYASNTNTAEEDVPKVSNIEELQHLYRQASVPVWRTKDTGSPVSIISAVVVLMTMCSTHGVSNAFADELFKYLSSSLLPTQNFFLSHSTMGKLWYRRWDSTTT